MNRKEIETEKADRPFAKAVIKVWVNQKADDEPEKNDKEKERNKKTSQRSEAVTERK
jgi:hypothetical protein